jgi:hypothetical protein
MIMWKLILTLLYFSGWYALYRWGSSNDKQNVVVLAWLMGGISVLMLIFGVLNWELTLLGYR